MHDSLIATNAMLKKVRRHPVCGTHELHLGITFIQTVKALSIRQFNIV